MQWPSEKLWREPETLWFLLTSRLWSKLQDMFKAIVQSSVAIDRSFVWQHRAQDGSGLACTWTLKQEYGHMACEFSQRIPGNFGISQHVCPAIRMSVWKERRNCSVRLSDLVRGESQLNFQVTCSNAGRPNPPQLAEAGWRNKWGLLPKRSESRMKKGGKNTKRTQTVNNRIWSWLFVRYGQTDPCSAYGNGSKSIDLNPNKKNSCIQ